MSYINRYGLINSTRHESVAENAPLWAWQYILMTDNMDMFMDLTLFVDSCYTGTNGLYNQRPYSTGSNEDYMSPDQLIPFAACTRSPDIFKYLVQHLFTYDNLTGKINFNRIQQPASVLFTGVVAGFSCLIPLLSLVCIVACFSKPDQTSGKLKAWTMIESLGLRRTKKVCEYILNKRSNFRTFSGCFLEYFKEEGHPIREVVLRKEV